MYSHTTNKAKMYSYSIFVQQMYWLQDKYVCMYENNSYQSYAPFCTLNLQNVWFPDDSPWMKSQIDSRYGILVYLRSIYVMYDNDDFSTIPTELCPSLYFEFAIFFLVCGWSPMREKIRLKLGAVCKCILWISRVSSIMTIFRQFLPELCPFLCFKFAILFVSDTSYWSH